MSAVPEATVIIVAYNHADFVVDALESVRAQSLPPSRVVVVDDGSSDETVSTVRDWAAQTGHPVELVHDGENHGLCRRLNEALATVETPLYTYLSADDRMRSDRLEKQVARWREGGGRAVGVYSHARRIDRHGEALQPEYRELHDWPRSEDLEGKIHTGLLRQCWIPAASVLLSTEAVRAVGGYDERWFFEDYDLWLRLAAHGEFLLVDESLVDFRELDTSLGSRRFVDTDLGNLEARVGIWLKQVAVSEEGDEYLRIALPPLAIRLWRRGGDPDLARAAFEAFPEQRNLRFRAALIRAGLKREPRLLTAASGAAGRLRATMRGVR